MGDRMRKHDARMIIQKFIGRTFRGTRKAFKAKKLETKRKDHPQHHLYMKKDGRVEKFVDLCMEQYKCYEEGYVGLEELAKLLKDEARVKIKGWEAEEIKR